MAASVDRRRCPFWRRPFSIGAAASAFVLAACAATSAIADQTAKPFQLLALDDLFRVESLDAAAFSPDAARLAYERGASKVERPSSAYASGLQNQSVHLVDLATREARGIASTDASVRYSLETGRLGAPFSPDGRHLALFARGTERAGFAVYDTHTNTLRTLPGEPRTAFPANAWIDDARFLYAAAAPGEGVTTYFQFLNRLTDRWGSVWRATAAQASVTSANPLVAGDRKPAGTLWMAHVDSGAATEIAGGDYTRVIVSPDGKRFAAVRRGAPVSHQTYDNASGELQVFLVTPAGARLEGAFPDFDVAWQWLEWSPDSRRLLVGGRPLAAGAAPARLLVYETRSSALRDAGLTDATLDFLSGMTGFGVAQVGWLGTTPLAIGSRFVGADAAPASTTGVGQPAGMRFDLWALTPRGPRNLTGFASSGVKAFADPVGYEAAFVVTDGALWRVAPDRDAERISPQDGPTVIDFALPDFSLAPARTAFTPARAAPPSAGLRVRREGRVERVAFDLTTRTYSRARGEGRVLALSRDVRQEALARPSGHALSLTIDGPAGDREIARLNAFLDERADGEVVALDYEFEGTALRSWLVLPPGRMPGTRLPAVAYVYCGKHWLPGDAPPESTRSDSATPFSNGQLMAAQGYAMLYPALPSKPGSDADVPSLIARQTIAAIDEAAAKGLIDPVRVAVMGHSFGGFSVAAILARQSDRFRAGIALAGVYNFITAYGARDLRRSLAAEPGFWGSSMDYVERIQIRLGAPPWSSPEAYIRNSPLFAVEQMNAPLLILQGDLDYDVTSLYGAEQMYAALVRAGKKPVLARYWGEGHVAQSLPNIRDQWNRIVAWLGAHLKG